MQHQHADSTGDPDACMHYSTGQMQTITIPPADEPPGRTADPGTTDGGEVAGPVPPATEPTTEAPHAADPVAVGSQHTESKKVCNEGHELGYTMDAPSVRTPQPAEEGTATGMNHHALGAEPGQQVHQSPGKGAGPVPSATEPERRAPRAASRDNGTKKQRMEQCQVGAQQWQKHQRDEEICPPRIAPF